MDYDEETAVEYTQKYIDRENELAEDKKYFEELAERSKNLDNSKTKKDERNAKYKR